MVAEASRRGYQSVSIKKGLKFQKYGDWKKEYQRFTSLKTQDLKINEICFHTSVFNEVQGFYFIIKALLPNLEKIGVEYKYRLDLVN